MPRLLRGFTVLPIILFLTACGVQENLDGAQEEIRNFHIDYNAQQYDGIWDNADPLLKKASKKDDFLEILQGVRRILGEQVQSEQAGWNIQATPQGNFLVITQQTEFERGKGTEIFTFSQVDERKKLAGYQVNSPDMIKGLMEQNAGENSALPVNGD